MADTLHLPNEPQRPVVANKDVSKPSTGDTVVVACKVPNGLVMSYYTKQKRRIANPTGTEEVEVQVPVRNFTIAGPNAVFNPHTSPPPMKLVHPQLEKFWETYGGYALTPGCPKEIWDQWRKANFLLVEEHIVAAFLTVEEAITWCLISDHKDARSGMEPIDPEHPEKTVPARIRNPMGGVSQVQPAQTAPLV